MDSSESVDTPMVDRTKLDEDLQGKTIDPIHYREMIGSLMYLTSSTTNMGLWYSKDTNIALTAFADVDYDGCQDTKKYFWQCPILRRHACQLVIKEAEKRYYLQYTGRIHWLIWILCSNSIDEITTDRLWI
ncbi:hypothetical protein Tco_1424586 [Tanacetum coccineum]